MRRGQMTVEFVVVFPVLLVVALVATNALLFMSDCATFDRVFREQVTTWAPSPGYGESSSTAAAHVQSAIDGALDGDYLDASVSALGGTGICTFEGTLSFTPTLFGHGRLSGVFGISFPKLTHHQSLVVEVYRPGVLL
jgi:hypothetical protein